MSLHEYRVLFVTVTGVFALLVASPALSRLLVYPQTEFFTEFWILGPAHKAEGYPFNVTRNQNYTVFLGIANHLGYGGYYLIEVKLRNATQQAPDSFNRIPSSLPPLHNITAFVADKETWELPLTFSLDYAYNETSLQIEFSSLRLNNVELSLTDYTTAWNSTRKGFLSNLFFELWIYNTATSRFQYHERFIALWLNMTM